MNASEVFFRIIFDWFKVHMISTVLILFRYAVLCGYVSEFEGLQNKINYGYRFKVFLDIKNVFM